MAAQNDVNFSEQTGLQSTAEYSKPNFDLYVTRIIDAKSDTEVWKLITAFCVESEFSGACCRCFPSDATVDQDIYFSRTAQFDKKIEKVILNTPGYLDPFLHASIRSNSPFSWEKLDKLLSKTAPQLQYFKRYIAHLGYGVIVPVFGPMFRNGYLCFIQDKQQAILPRVLVPLHSLSQTAYLKLSDLMYKSTAVESPLSARELEVINLISRGKSNPDIASKLGISRSTVNTHTQRVFDKLGVSDRVSAVMRACALGYVA